MPEPGSYFNIEGYEFVARAAGADTGGDVIVLHNNSSHYLVARRPWPAGCDGWNGDKHACLVVSIPYSEDEDETHASYYAALQRMITEAMNQ